MAITRRWQSGAETGHKNEFSNVVGGFVVTTANKYTGAYSFKDPTSNDYGYQTIPATRQIRVGFFLYGNSSRAAVRFEIRDAGTNQLVGLFLSTSGAISLQVLDATKDTKAGINVFEWHHFLVDVKIDNAAGWAKVYRDGIEVLSFAGNTGNADISDVKFGNGSFTGTYPCYWDDIYIDDTAGEGAAVAGPVLRFNYLTPNGNGNYSQWDGSDGNQVDNYLLVDEVPPSDADYVETAVVDEFDSYAMTTRALDVGESFIAVIPVARVQRGDITEEIALGTRYSGTDVVGSDQVPETPFNYLWERQTVKPGGGAWDQAAVDGVEALIKSRGSY